MKNLLLLQLIVVVLFSCSSPTGQKDKETQKENNYLTTGQVVDLQKAKLLVTALQISGETPVNKVKPKIKTNHFILVSLKIKEIDKEAQLSSVLFILMDSENKKYESPGSWGKIDLGGGPANFEATEGATIFSSKVDDEINLIFEVPESIMPEKTMLQYNWK